MSPPPQEVFRGKSQQKRKKMEFERKQKNKKGRKKKKKRDVARIFRVLSLFKALCVVILCYIWFYTIGVF